jgi:protoporphyrinogen oxidase
MPLNKLVQSLDPPLPADVMDAARRLVYRDYLTVVLIVKREHVFPDQWIYIHTPDVKVARIQNYKNWSSEMVPDPSRTSLGMEYFLSTYDPMWRWSQDQLIDLAVRESVQLGIVRPGEIEDGTVVRMKGAYPVYDANYRGHVERIRRYLAKFLNLQTVGRNGLHRYNNQDHSMLTAIYAARNILGDNQDVWSVNTDLAYHEEDLVGKSCEDRMVPVPLRPKPLEG